MLLHIDTNEIECTDVTKSCSCDKRRVFPDKWLIKEMGDLSGDGKYTQSAVRDTTKALAPIGGPAQSLRSAAPGAFKPSCITDRSGRQANGFPSLKFRPEVRLAHEICALTAIKDVSPDCDVFACPSRAALIRPSLPTTYLCQYLCLSPSRVASSQRCSSACHAPRSVRPVPYFW